MNPRLTWSNKNKLIYNLANLLIWIIFKINQLTKFYWKIKKNWITNLNLNNLQSKKFQIKKLHNMKLIKLRSRRILKFWLRLQKLNLHHWIHSRSIIRCKKTLSEPREKSNCKSTEKERWNKWWSNRNKRWMRIRKTNSHYSTINMIHSKASTLMRVSNRWTMKHQRSKTRMLSLSHKSTVSILNLKETPSQGQEMELSISIISRTILLWINKSRKRRNLKNKQLKLKPLHLQLQLTNATAISAVNALLKLQANITHLHSQIHSWEDNSWCHRWWTLWLSKLSKDITVTSIQWLWWEVININATATNARYSTKA